MLRIKNIDIQNINSINTLYLEFQPGVNILCGSNGVGKTTILECIANTFHFSSTVIKNSVNSEEGAYNINLIMDDQRISHSIDVSINNMDHYGRLRSPQRIRSDKFIYHKISQRNSRSFSRVRIEEDGDMYARSDYDSIKRWLYRCYFKKEQLTDSQFSNLILTKEVFNKLDSDVNFIEATEKEAITYSHADKIKVVEILVRTPYGIISIDAVSSGYKACFCILFGIIRSIEERLRIPVEDFNGVVLIDEIDLHLHPEWQTKILNVLKWLIPNAQIILTTHSPHVIQTAERGEIIPLGIDNKNRVFVRELPESSEYGYQGWTVEEILVHVMGLSDPRSKVFRNKLNKFEEALNTEDTEAILDNYKALKAMIHHRNPLTTLLKIQAGEFFEDEEEFK